VTELAPTTVNPGLRSFCTFRAQDRLYGLDVTNVREVSTQVTLTPVPQAPLLVRGLANLRSRIYLVLDLRPALGLPPVERTADSRLIVLHPRIAEGLGLFVERGGDIVHVAADQIEEMTPAAGSGRGTPQPLPYGRGSDQPLPHGRGSDQPAEVVTPPATVIVGVCKLDAELMMILDPARLVTALENEMRGPADQHWQKTGEVPS
jgi:purine-binding chemotaxis protein CheW